MNKLDTLKLVSMQRTERGWDYIFIDEDEKRYVGFGGTETEARRCAVRIELPKKPEGAPCQRR